MDFDTRHNPDPAPSLEPFAPPVEAPERPARFAMNAKTLSIFFILLGATVFTTQLVGGWGFSIGLLLILGAHEFGHYWACRKHDVDATLPNFLPAPPLFIAGTFGAFIAIKEPIPDKRALMEIGAWGPIAGFVMGVPVMALGLVLSDVSLSPAPEGGVNFGGSLILVMLTKLILGVNPLSNDVTVLLHPVAFAGWLGMFFTALNLLPIGQLDGGHVVYSLFRSWQPFLARLFFLSLFPLGLWWEGWWVWALLVVLVGLKHPPVLDESVPLDSRQIKLGYACVVIFILTFVPVPFDFIQ